MAHTYRFPLSSYVTASLTIESLDDDVNDDDLAALREYIEITIRALSKRRADDEPPTDDQLELTAEPEPEPVATE